MKKQNSSREYNFPDADLYLQCLDRIRFAMRDIEHFETYGYSKPKLQSFHKKCQQFEQLPSDDEVLGDQMLMTEKKNGKREELKSAIRSVMTRVSTKYNNKSGRYRKFGTYKMNDMSDAQLLLCGRRVVRVAKKQVAFLEETGMRMYHLDKVWETAIDFEKALDLQHDKVADRDIAVEKRVELGNLLYNELVHLCNIGKDIWAETDKTKYEQYTIYESNNEQKKRRKMQQS